MRHPKLLVTYLPRVLKSLIEYKTGKIPNHLMQLRMFSYLTMVDDFDVQIERYWDKLVTNHAQTVTDWPGLDPETVAVVKKKIDTGWNIHLKE